MSGSRIQDARDAAKQFVSQLDDDDEAQVIAFDSFVEIIERWTKETGQLTTAIDSITAGGQTALFDAVIEGVEEASPRLGRSAVIVLADGQDNSSSASISDAIDAAQTNSVPVYTIGLGDTIDPTNLNELASETGGDYYETVDSSDLASIYEQINQSIANEYEITYQTGNTATDGSIREVELTATHGGESGSDIGFYESPCAPLPNASFDIDPPSPTIGQEVVFDGSASSPNGGSIAAYMWDFTNDGVTDATGETVTHAYSEPGSYEARLTVEKGCGASDATIVPIEVADVLFPVEIVDTNAPLTEGESLQVEIEVTNTGTENQITTATLDLDPITDSVSRPGTTLGPIGPGETVTHTFEEIETNIGDAGTYTAVVETNDATATTSITIEESSTGSFEEFKTQKLGGDSTVGLAPRIDNLTTFAVEEEQTVSENIAGIEEALDNDEIDLDLAEETVERMVLGEQVLNRALEGLTAEPPLDSQQTDYDLLFESSKALVVGLVEASVKLKTILAEAKSEVIGWFDINPVDMAVDYIKDAIRNYLREMLSDLGLEISGFYTDIIEAGKDIYKEIDSGDPYEALRELVLLFAEPIADQLAGAFLTAYETVPSFGIESQLDTMNTALRVEEVTVSEFDASIGSARIERLNGLSNIDQRLQDVRTTMNPESDTLRDLLEDVLELLRNPSFDQLWSIITTVANVVADLISVIREGFNAGVGFTAAGQIVSESEERTDAIVQFA